MIRLHSDNPEVKCNKQWTKSACISLYKSNNPEYTLKGVSKQIRADWENINPIAEIYLKSLEQCNTLDSIVNGEDGAYWVSYFLANANGWRGEKARTIKNYLRKIKEYYYETI